MIPSRVIDTSDEEVPKPEPAKVIISPPWTFPYLGLIEVTAGVFEAV